MVALLFAAHVAGFKEQVFQKFPVPCCVVSVLMMQAPVKVVVAAKRRSAALLVNTRFLKHPSSTR
jgi:hypothetical protein